MVVNQYCIQFWLYEEQGLYSNRCSLFLEQCSHSEASLKIQKVVYIEHLFFCTHSHKHTHTRTLYTLHSQTTSACLPAT